jgi:hypothetical protein
MRKQVLRLCLIALVGVAVPACSASGGDDGSPELAPRGETLTTVKPTRQNLSNRVSLSGKVTMNPVFGLVAPVAGEVRYRDVKPTGSTPTKPTKVAAIWARGKARQVTVPAGATFAGRLVDDRSSVAAGMPIVSAKLAGYGLVADIDGAQAYRISDALASVQAQVKNGPGPFTCTVLGTIAALPPGTIPEPPAEKPDPKQSQSPDGPPAPPSDEKPSSPGEDGASEPSEPTGLRLVCTPPSGVKLINGATATLDVVTEKAANALVVPVEAVAGSHGKGKVDVVTPDRRRETRDVVLGLSDGKVVQIKSGLTGTETLAVPGPNLPPAEAQGDGSSGPR